MTSSFWSLFYWRDLAGRDSAVDAFRGLTIIGMIMVNHRPPTDAIYSIFRHAPWNGWTLADTIFPAFLFLVGVSISYSLGKKRRSAGGAPYGKIFRRTIILIAISYLLVNFPYFDPNNLILTGTLARIGLCYCIASLIFWHTQWRAQIMIIAAIWVTQTWVLMYFNVPGHGRGVITAEGNASQYLDVLLMGSFTKTLVLNGPVIQGILPTAAGVSSTLIGVLAGGWLQTSRPIESRIVGLFAVGFILMVAGSAWSYLVPINKSLWTASFAMLMGGLAMQILAMMYWIVDRLDAGGVVKPLEVAGVNALFFYVFAQSMQRVLVYGRVTTDEGSPIQLRYLIYQNWVEPLLPGKPGALLYAMVFLLLCYLVVLLLYRRRIFFRL